MTATLQPYFLEVQNLILSPEMSWGGGVHDFPQSLQQNLGAEPKIGE
jgi:hypothetical protein